MKIYYCENCEVVTDPECHICAGNAREIGYTERIEHE